MITQNPIIGRAKKKLAGVYARTLYGKNVIQTCPPSTKGHQTENQLAVCKTFGSLSQLSNQVTASLLNSLYYAAPVGRSRRGQWCKDLATGLSRTAQGWTFDPSAIQILGGNQKVSEEPYILTPNETHFEIDISSLSAVGNAITSDVPCLILICPSKNICISLLPYTTLNDNVLEVHPISTTLVGNECYVFPLWRINLGTQANPIFAYGSYQKSH